MKKVISLILVIVTLALLCGCGRQTYTCQGCLQEVTQKPITRVMFGEEVTICKDCNKALDELYEAIYG